jgi:DNA polymerase III subunit epsilon
MLVISGYDAQVTTKPQPVTRKLHLARTLAFLDLETTGTDPRAARILEIGILQVTPEGTTDRFETRVNPGISIPAEATRVHGISNDDVKNKPTFRELAQGIADRLAGCDIAGFNVVRYDWPLLLAEFERAGYAFDARGRYVIDVMTLFHMKEPRDLTAAVKFYCGSDHSSAHSAFGDAEATWRVLTAQLGRYGDLPVDIAELAKLCTKCWIELVDGEPVLVKGQYNGKQVRTVAADDPSYLDWVLALPDISFADAEIIRSLLTRTR